MHVRIRLIADPERSCIHVILRNIEELPVKRYRFAPSQFSAELLEKLARLLVREEARLVEVNVSQGYRAQLRQKIESEKRQKEEDLALALAEKGAQDQAREESKLLHRLKRVYSTNKPLVRKGFRRMRKDS